MSARRDAVAWTVVTLDRRARFARPVAGATPGAWEEAREQAAWLQAVLPATTDVWYVPTQDSPQHPEDRDNLLVSDSRGALRRVPIRWDAEPRYSMAGAEYPAHVRHEYVVGWER